MEFLSFLMNGISLGSIYAIIALGYTMVYGIAKMLNFAHGDIIMVGGYLTTGGRDPKEDLVMTADLGRSRTSPQL